jgi:TrmH family RNA methyltransferase
LVDISSRSNDKIKKVLRLREKSDRNALGVFMVEGAREISHALSGHYQALEVFYCEELLSDAAQKCWDLFKSSSAVKSYSVTRDVFSRIVVREGSDGILVVFRQREMTLASLPDKEDLFLILLEDVEKPGNLGAALRTADGAGVDGVIIVNEKADIYNPNVIRASLGAVFNLPVIVASKEKVGSFFKEKGIKIVCATPAARQLYYEVDLTQSIAVVLGSEAFGVSQYWLDTSSHLLKIPMKGSIDSLNVSVAAGIMMYEVVRQRNIVSIRP